MTASRQPRVLHALESMPQHTEALAQLRPDWMDKGHSTALEGEICIDLLYVAASKSFEELRQHIQTVLLNGIPVVTLDVDGMLQPCQQFKKNQLVAHVNQA